MNATARSGMFALLVAVSTCVAPNRLLADVPLPGQDSITPKYWPAVHRWVTNFSPFDFGGFIVGLTSDSAQTARP